MTDSDCHTLRLTSAYGDLLDSAEVPGDELAGALRRFHDQAVTHVHSVVVVDGVVQTRNAFLEFVRHFNDTAGRPALPPRP
jgi:hypothetical protein